MHRPIDLARLPGDDGAHTLVGAEHGVPISAFLIHSSPGEGPNLHRHPYPELFLIESGTATFVVDGAEFEACGGQLVVAPAWAWHRFENAGPGELRLTAIHPREEFDTQWLAQAQAARAA